VLRPKIRFLARAGVPAVLVVLVVVSAARAASAPSHLAPVRGAALVSSVYKDPIDDAGSAPDVVEVAIRPVDEGALEVAIALARPTALGPFGWILVGFDTDRNRSTGGMHGSEVIVLVNGDRAAIARRVRGRFAVGPLAARLTSTSLSFRLAIVELHAGSFDFAVATLRRDADVAPDVGVFRYPLRSVGEPVPHRP
jgi:hypothetical protein